MKNYNTTIKCDLIVVGGFWNYCRWITCEYREIITRQLRIISRSPHDRRYLSAVYFHYICAWVTLVQLSHLVAGEPQHAGYRWANIFLLCQIHRDGGYLRFPHGISLLIIQQATTRRWPRYGVTEQRRAKQMRAAQKIEMCSNKKIMFRGGKHLKQSGARILF